MTTAAIRALERAATASDIDSIRIEITAALNALRQQPATYNDLTLHPRLMREIAKFPTAAAAAKALGVTRQTLHAAVNGAGGKPVPPSILRRIGLERVPRGLNQYREI